jgi:hypothetical protein
MRATPRKKMLLYWGGAAIAAAAFKEKFPFFSKSTDSVKEQGNLVKEL